MSDSQQWGGILILDKSPCFAMDEGDPSIVTGVFQNPTDHSRITLKGC